jgi:transcriptional regulator with XRE-family HTH domain
MSVYGKRIKELREKAGLDVKKLAFRCKFTRSRLANYETGIRTPGIDEILNVAEALKPFLGDNLAVYLVTGDYAEVLIRDHKESAFTVSNAVDEFQLLISDAVDYGRIQLEPTLKVADLVESFSKSCGSYLGSNADQKTG